MFHHRNQILKFKRESVTKRQCFHPDAIQQIKGIGSPLASTDGLKNWLASSFVSDGHQLQVNTHHSLSIV